MLISLPKSFPFVVTFRFGISSVLVLPISDSPKYISAEGSTNERSRRKEGGKEQLVAKVTAETLTWINQGNINTQFLECGRWEGALLPQIFHPGDPSERQRTPLSHLPIPARSNYLFSLGVNVFGGLLCKSQQVLEGHNSPVGRRRYGVCCSHYHTRMQEAQPHRPEPARRHKNKHVNTLMQKQKRTNTHANVRFPSSRTPHPAPLRSLLIVFVVSGLGLLLIPCGAFGCTIIMHNHFHTAQVCVCECVCGAAGAYTCQDRAGGGSSSICHGPPPSGLISSLNELSKGWRAPTEIIQENKSLPIRC